MRIRTMETETVLLDREPLGVWDENGDYIKSDIVESIEFKCSLQPLKEGLKQSILPEGVRTNDAYIVYSKNELKPSENLTKRDGDVIIIDGYKYDVFSVEHWRQLRTAHYKSIIVRRSASG